MTKKRLLLIGGFLAACVCLPLGVVAIMPPSYDRIEKGMTRMEVEQILGAPRDPHTTWDRWLYWDAEDGSVAALRLGFGLFNNSVIDGHWVDSNETILNKIRRWLHLP